LRSKGKNEEAVVEKLEVQKVEVPK